MRRSRTIRHRAKRSRDRSVPRPASSLCAALLFGCLLLPAGAQAQYESASGKEPQAQFRARLRLDYEYRKQGSAKDNDLYGYWSGSGRDLRGGTLDLYTSGRLYSDLDSSKPSFADDPYFSVDDANGVTEQRLLQLYADLHDKDDRWRIRAGRQYVDIADYLHLDGAQIIVREEEKLGGRVYVGRPVSYYSSVSGDYAGGLSLVGRPWAGNRTRFTFAEYHDDSMDGSDENYFVDVYQDLTDAARARLQLSVLNQDFRMARGDLFYFSPDGETDFYIGASHWGTFDANTRVYSPLYEVLGEQQPYTYAYARLTQQIVPKFLISPGVSMRFTDEDFSNRDYNNYDITLIYEPNHALSTSVSLQYWDVQDSDRFVGLSGELRYRHQKSWEVSGGASYAKYTYDTFSDITYTANGGQTTFSEGGTVIEQSPDVYTYFLRSKWRITKKLILRVQGDIEDDKSASDLAYRGRGSIEVRF